MEAEVKLFKAIYLLSEVVEYFGNVAGEELRRIQETELRKDLDSETKEKLLKELNKIYERAGNIADTIHFAIMLILRTYLEYYKENIEGYPEMLGLCRGGEK